MFSFEYCELLLAASVLEIHREFDYINREIDVIYFQNNTLCLFFSF